MLLYSSFLYERFHGLASDFKNKLGLSINSARIVKTLTYLEEHGGPKYTQQLTKASAPSYFVSSVPIWSGYYCFSSVTKCSGIVWHRWGSWSLTRRSQTRYRYLLMTRILLVEKNYIKNQEAHVSKQRMCNMLSLSLFLTGGRGSSWSSSQSWANQTRLVRRGRPGHVYYILKVNSWHEPSQRVTLRNQNRLCGTLNVRPSHKPS